MPRPYPHVDGVQHEFVQAGEVRLHVATAGPAGGEPVVLLHGWPQHWYMWRHQIPALAADGYRVIAPDLRGFGWSDAPHSSYAKEEFARDTVALLDALGLDRVRLAGHDWGAFTGWLLTLEHPERISSYVAVAVAPPWLPGRTPPTALPAVLAYQPWISTPFLGAQLQRRAPFVETVFRVAGGRRIWSEEEEREFTAQYREPDRAEAASRVYRTFLTRELPAMLRGRYRRGPTTVRSLMLAPTGDPIVGPPKPGYPDPIEVREVQGGHFLPEHKPELVTAALREWFSTGGA